MIQKNDGSIRSGDLRHCRHYARFLAREFRVNEPYGWADNSREICHQINSFILQKLPALKDRRSFAQAAGRFKDNELIRDDQFTWLKANEVACYMAWLFLSRTSYREADELLPQWRIGMPDSYYGSTRSIYQDIGGEECPASHSLRLEQIMRFFDLWESSVGAKRDLLQHLKQQWSEVLERGHSFKWLDKKDLDQVLWARDYLRKEPSFFSRDRPLNEKDMYLSILSSFYLWDVPPDTKTVLHTKMAKAWSQKKFRDKNKNNKPLNIFLSPESKEMLSQLARNWRMNHAETVEELIMRVAEEEQRLAEELRSKRTNKS